MQLLFEEFESLSKASRNAGDTQTSGLIDFLCERKAVALEKEKEQIMNAYEDGYEACDMDEAMEVNKKLTSGDLYYNMNYNQNK